jgi:phosphate/sulfate permease
MIFISRKKILARIMHRTWSYCSYQLSSEKNKVLLLIMSQLSLSHFSENLPVSGTIAITQAAVGCGVGLLIADKMSCRARHRTSLFLLVTGALIVVPVMASCLSRIRNRPHSKKRVLRQLESIRGDVGFTEEASCL